MARVMEWRRDDEARELRRRNRRTAWLLIGWIACLCALSIIVIWVRN